MILANRKDKKENKEAPKAPKAPDRPRETDVKLTKVLASILIWLVALALSPLIVAWNELRWSAGLEAKIPTLPTRLKVLPARLLVFCVVMGLMARVG
jgi:hypothetical protein